MYILQIIMILLGLLFLGFGYEIWFKEKYDLVNNYEKNMESGKLDDSFFERVGKIEFVGGIFCLVIGIINIFLNNIVAWISFIICILSILIALIINQIKSKK